jgi:hypothetical protein
LLSGLDAIGLVDIDRVCVSRQGGKSDGRLSYQRYAVIDDRCSMKVRERRTNVSLLTEEFQQMERKTKEVR